MSLTPGTIDTPVAWLTKYSEPGPQVGMGVRSEEHTSELQSLRHLVCRLLLEKKKRRRAFSYPDQPAFPRPYAEPAWAHWSPCATRPVWRAIPSLSRLSWKLGFTFRQCRRGGCRVPTVLLRRTPLISSRRCAPCPPASCASSPGRRRDSRGSARRSPFFFTQPPTPATYTLSLHDALPI